MALSTRARLLELERGQPIARQIQDAWRQHPSYRTCAARLGVSVNTLRRWMVVEGLRPSRNPLRPGLVSDKRGLSAVKTESP